MSTTRLKQIETAFLFILLAGLPVFLLNNVSNPLVTPKLIFLAVYLVIIFFLKAVRNLMSKTKGLVFGTSSLDLPVILLAAAYGASGYLVTPNRMEAFWLPGTASFVIGGALLYFAIHQLSEHSKQFAKLALVIGATLCSFVAIVVSSGVLKGMESLPAYMRSDMFNPVGSLLALAIFLLAIIPMALDSVMHSENVMVKALSGVAVGLCGLALLMSVTGIIKNWNQSQLPSITTSWIVATDSLKERPFMGTGAGNYLSAFTRFLPLSYNATPQWNLRFANASNFYLTAITETGLFGLAAIVILLLALYRRVRMSAREAHLLTYLPIVILAVAFALFPASPTLIFVFFALLALTTRTHVVHVFTPQSEESGATIEGKVATFLVAVPVIALTIFVSYLTIQATRGEMIYQNALAAVAAQDGKKAYDTLRDAININPYSDRYHLSYAQLNLALANALASKKDLTTEEKNTISQLVQQSIREGRSAVVLNRERAANWETLASIYRAVMPLAKGADQFAIQTYSQTIALDPVNPNTRLALGGVFYGLKRYEEAIDVFKLAVVSKPDNANSHYNLAIAYRDNGQYDKALAELSGVLTLVSKDSKDYEVAKKELENVQSKAPKKDVPAKSDNLTPPAKISDEEKLSPKIAIPEDATPPAAPVTQQPAN